MNEIEALVPKDKTNTHISCFLIADDIRAEVGEKHSLVGVYKGEHLSIPEIPYKFSKLCFYVILTDLPVGAYDLFVDVICPNNSRRALIENSLDVSENGNPVLHLTLTNFDITEIGEYTLVLKFGGCMTIIVSKKFYVDSVE